jgi:hypothetical protein
MIGCSYSQRDFSAKCARAFPLRAISQLALARIRTSDSQFLALTVRNASRFTSSPLQAPPGASRPRSPVFPREPRATLCSGFRRGKAGRITYMTVPGASCQATIAPFLRDISPQALARFRDIAVAPPSGANGTKVPYRWLIRMVTLSFSNKKSGAIVDRSEVGCQIPRMPRWS